MAVSFLFAIHGAVCGSFDARLPSIAAHAHAGPGGLGVALLVPTAGTIVMMPAAGRIAHRIGDRTATVLLVVALCCVIVGPALAPDLPALCLAMLLFGATAGASDVVMNAQGVAVERMLGRSIMAGMHGLWSAGGVVGGLIGAGAALVGMPAWLHLSILALLLSVLVALIGPGLLERTAEPGAAPPPRFAAPSRAVLVVGMVAFCAMFCESAAQNWSAVYLKDVAGASAAIAAMSYTAFALSMTAARLTGDLAVRKAGAVRCVRIGGALACAGAMLVAFARNPLLAIAGFVMIGLGVAIALPLVFVAAASTTANPSQGVAGAGTVAYTAEFVAPGTIGAIGAVASLSDAFIIVALIAAAMTVSASALGRGHVGPAGARRHHDMNSAEPDARAEK